MIFLFFLLAALAAAAGYLLFEPAAYGVTVLGALGAAALGWLAANLLFLLLIIVNWLFLPRLKPGEGIERQRPLCRWICENAARFLCGYAGERVRLIGLEKLPDTPFLFVSNHRSGFDPLTAMGYLGKYNIAFVTKPSNISLSLIGLTARHAGYLAIDRDSDRAALRTILQAADYLKRGVCSVGIYPEGTRNKTGAPLLPFHAGSFKIAQKANVPLVIVCMRGTEKVLKTPLVYRTPVELEVVEVLDAATVKGMRTVALAEHTRQKLEEALKKA